MRWKFGASIIVAVLAGGALPASMGCNTSQIDPIDCNTADVKGFSEIQDAVGYCTSRHGGGNPRAGVSLATYDDAVASADEIADAVASGDMPPDGMPDAQQLELVTWAQCGTPE